MSTGTRVITAAALGIMMLGGTAGAQTTTTPATPPQPREVPTAPRTATPPGNALPRAAEPTAPTAATPPAGAAPLAANTTRGDAPASGANSFTERQARSRITDAGFGEIASIALGEDGVWRGRAMRNGAAEDVAMDFRGEIFTGAAARAPAAGSRSEAARPAARP